MRLKHTYKERYERLKAEVDQRELIPTVDEAVAYLQVRAIGKRIDETYIAYCGAIIREYLSKRKRVNCIVQLAVLKGAMAMHMATLDTIRIEWDMHTIMRYNDDTNHKWTLKSTFLAILELIIAGLVIEYIFIPLFW